MVKLLFGCIGILLILNYVMMVVYCVYDGVEFYKNMEMFKILIFCKMGYRFYYVREIIVFYNW